MKHPASRAFYTYWDDKRAGARAPDRADIEPGALRELLGDIFVVSYDPEGGYPYRVAGTRICAMLGRDLKGESFVDQFDAKSRADISEILGVVGEEVLAAVAGVSAITDDGLPSHLELLLLPFSARAHTPTSITGLIAPFSRAPHVLNDLRLVSWRYLIDPPKKLVPRALRKLELVRGLMVYEGLK